LLNLLFSQFCNVLVLDKQEDIKYAINYFLAETLIRFLDLFNGSFT
jgi:hypothetical protein